MMKRIFAVLLTVALATTLTACGGSNATATKDPAGNRPSSAVASEPKPADPTDTDLFDPPLVDNIDKPSNVGDNTVATEAPTGTDASNYWDGDNHFDVIGYLEANGATDIRNSLEELPIGGQTMKVYWYTTCEISDWYIEIDWISGQISVRDNCLCCFSGRGSNDYGGDRDPNSDEFVFGNENGSLMPSRWVDELPAAISHIVSATPNSATCPYCGVSTDDPVVQQWLVSESPFEHSHQPLN